MLNKAEEQQIRKIAEGTLKSALWCSNKHLQEISGDFEWLDLYFKNTKDTKYYPDFHDYEFRNFMKEVNKTKIFGFQLQTYEIVLQKPSKLLVRFTQRLSHKKIILPEKVEFTKKV